jgi:hypothetical protein
MNTGAVISPEALIQLGWLAFYSIAVCVTAIAVMGCIAFWRTDSPAASFSRMFERAQALKMVTVLLIVLSLLILALVGKVGESGAVGVLSGIAGYVLGGLEKQSPLTGKPKAPAPKGGNESEQQ